MSQIAEQREVLACMLDPLCGTSGEKDADDTVRENLAEALLLLVTLQCRCECIQRVKPSNTHALPPHSDPAAREEGRLSIWLPMLSMVRNEG